MCVLSFMSKYLFPIFGLLLVFGCGTAEFSPNQKFNSGTPTDINAAQLSRLATKSPTGLIRIAVSSDTHSDYNDCKAFVNYINNTGGFDFVFLNGDVTNFGLLTEYEGVYEQYAKLQIPFLTVIGNHDENAEGPDVYRRMFGELNFTFSYGGVKFVCYDANSREHSFDGTIPDLGWLQQNIQKDADNQYVVSVCHVPPTDADFDQTLRPAYEKLITRTPGVIASIHSHQHSPDSVYRAPGASTPFIITNTILNRSFTVIEITNGQIKTYPVTF
jgi:Icc protein